MELGATDRGEGRPLLTPSQSEGVGLRRVAAAARQSDGGHADAVPVSRRHVPQRLVTVGRLQSETSVIASTRKVRGEWLWVWDAMFKRCGAGGRALEP